MDLLSNVFSIFIKTNVSFVDQFKFVNNLSYARLGLYKQCQLNLLTTAADVAYLFPRKSKVYQNQIIFNASLGNLLPTTLPTWKCLYLVNLIRLPPQITFGFQQYCLQQLTQKPILLNPGNSGYIGTIVHTTQYYTISTVVYNSIVYLGEGRVSVHTNTLNGSDHRHRE